jgi:Cu(I)/Ag(I) efflux system periplasmic protein CusF
MITFRRLFIAATMAGAIVSHVALAQMQMPMPMATPAPGQAMRGQTEGEVTRIAKDTNRITLKHGPIQAMDMAGMTMVFQVKDPALLDKVKVGDKVRFTVLRENGAMFVEALEPAGAAPTAGKLLEAPEDPHAAH